MPKNIVPQAVGTVASIHPTSMRVHWDSFGGNPDAIISITITSNEQDAAGAVVQSGDINIDVASLPPGRLVELNNLVNFMLDEYITGHGYTEQP